MRQKQLVHFNERLMAMFLTLRLRYTWYTDTHSYPEHWSRMINILAIIQNWKQQTLRWCHGQNWKKDVLLDWHSGPVWASGKRYPSQLFWKLQTENSGSKSLLATGCCQQQDVKTFAEFIKWTISNLNFHRIEPKILPILSCGDTPIAKTIV